MANLGSAVISWDDFHEERTNKIKHMLANQTFTDVTLLCNDVGNDQVAITAHRVILSAASEFFSRVLQREQDKGAVLYLRGASKENVISLLNFIYSGECSINISQLEEFVALGKDLKIKSLENYAKVPKVVNASKVLGGAPTKVFIPQRPQLAAQINKRTLVAGAQVSRPQTTTLPSAAPTRNQTLTPIGQLPPSMRQYRRIQPLGQLPPVNTPAQDANNPQEFTFVDTSAAEGNFENVLLPSSGSNPRGPSPVQEISSNNSDDKLARECQSIVKRLASSGKPVETKEEIEEIADTSVVEEDNEGEEEEEEVDDPKPKEPAVVDTKDPIALLEQKIESLIAYNDSKTHYTCKVCNFETMKRSHVVEHVELHIEGFIFSCNNCPETFRNRPSLRKHKTRCMGMA